jgi:hypothetical protein
MRTQEAARAAELASAKGYLTSAELERNCFDEDLARREVSADRWQRPARGFYVPHREPLDDVTLARIAVEYGGDQSLLTGLIAARALKMRWVPTLPGAQVLVPDSVRRRSTDAIAVRRSAGYASLSGWCWQGIATAPAERIVLDAAMRLPSLGLVRGLVLGAVADRWTTPDELTDLLAHEPRNGTALLRQAVRDARDGSASPPEAELVDALRGCRIPFLVNPELRLGGRTIGFPDGYFVGLGAGWEVDSRERHEGEEAFDATLGRHTTFGGHGLVLAHPTPRRIRMDTAGTAAAVLTVAQARLLLPPSVREPAGLEVVPRGPVIQ